MQIVWNGLMIDESGRILLLKRSNYTKMFPHHWTVPGGRWDPWETPEQVATREVKEETWLDFTPTKLYFDHIWEHSGKPLHSHRFLWIYSGDINVDTNEADGYAWYSYEETQNLKIAFTHADTIKKLYEDWLLK